MNCSLSKLTENSDGLTALVGAALGGPLIRGPDGGVAVHVSTILLGEEENTLALGRGAGGIHLLLEVTRGTCTMMKELASSLDPSSQTSQPYRLNRWLLTQRGLRGDLLGGEHLHAPDDLGGGLPHGEGGHGSADESALLHDGGHGCRERDRGWS